jgi:hypothetical protein
MTPQTLQALDRRLQRFGEDRTEPMGRSQRRRWARVYLEGLLLDGERQSMEAMAARVAGADVQAVRQFVGQSPWEVEEIERHLVLKVDLLSEPRLDTYEIWRFPAGNIRSGSAGNTATPGKVQGVTLERFPVLY